MKVWKMKNFFYSDVINELNNLEKKKAVIREITQDADTNWFTVFYTIEDSIEEEDE